MRMRGDARGARRFRDFGVRPGRRSAGKWILGSDGRDLGARYRTTASRCRGTQANKIAREEKEAHDGHIATTSTSTTDIRRTRLSIHVRRRANHPQGQAYARKEGTQRSGPHHDACRKSVPTHVTSDILCIHIVLLSSQHTCRCRRTHLGPRAQQPIAQHHARARK